MEKRTKIICTLGPAVDDEQTLVELIEAGMNVARLNFSHGSHAEHQVRIDRLKRVRERLGVPCALLLDTKGPEIRTGTLAGGGPVALEEGALFTLTAKECQGTSERVTQTAAVLPSCVQAGSSILLDDGLIELSVERVEGDDVVCRVANAGLLGERKSVNVPGVRVPLPVVTDQDRADLLFGIENDFDYVAASFVRDGAGVREVRAFLSAHGGGDIRIVAKIENADAVRNAAEIIEAADAVMVARGDLGVEVPAWRIPHIQKQIIRACNRESKPVVTATQMLDSMIRNPRPTRAEVADVAGAIYDGTDCVMLSGETAVGAHPVRAVRAMAHIARENEAHLFEECFPDRSRTHARPSLAVGIAAVTTAEALDAACIVTPTLSGRTPRLISNLRPRVPIFAVTPHPRVMRQLQLSWGVTALLGDTQGDMRRVIDQARESVRACGLVEAGDVGVLTAGDPHTSPLEDVGGGKSAMGPTNALYVVEFK
ncbi:pyruvate kinase [Adlercreutzia sp. ZJ473]|uniref:pyruvate kinase n=1 Tax=Adlercreutzia sp. ZJ473 TaxID=2722822 RepID=UPI0015572AEC|nr:pyruvate kinase [Adlercreutzia sp. ZJ473]